MNNFNGITEVHVHFKDGTVTVAKGFDWSAEQRIEMLQLSLDCADAQSERYEKLIAKLKRDDEWVTAGKYAELKKEYEFQESRLTALADAIVDTRIAMQAKLDAALAELAYMKGNRP
jgi:hypothetical protein